MTENDNELGFSWIEFFIATGICFSGFCFFFKLINTWYPPVFSWIGITSLILGSIMWLVAIAGTPSKTENYSHSENAEDIFDSFQ